MVAEPEPARASDALLIEHAEQDLEKGLARIRARIRETHGPVSGTAIDALVVGAVATLRLRSRRRDDARFLLDLAHRVRAGEDPDALAREHVDHVLRLRESLCHVARGDDPDFGRVKAIATELFARRLPDLARLASVEDPEDYDDLVRKAFPDRSYVESMVDENFRMVESMVEHFERHPHLLHAPRSLTPKLAAMARDMIAWTASETKRGVDEIYRPSRAGFLP